MPVTECLQDLNETHARVTVSLPELSQVSVTPTKERRDVLQGLTKVTFQQTER